jgi:hypothetical protein
VEPSYDYDFHNAPRRQPLAIAVIGGFIIAVDCIARYIEDPV